MVVVLGLMAAAVERLALRVAHLVDLPALGHGGQVPVNRGQAHLGALGLKGGVYLLGGSELLRTLKNVVDRGALPGGPGPC